MFFGKVMDLCFRRLDFQAANNRRGQDNISDRTEADDKDFFQGIFFSRRGPLMNRRVSQNIDNMRFNSAELCEKLCETLRDILFFTFYWALPKGEAVEVI